METKSTLLEKTRTINKLIQRAAGNPVDFEEMAKVLGQAVTANCYIVGRRGKILGYSFMEGFDCGVMEDIVVHTERFPESYNEGLMKITGTITNTTQVANGCVFSNEPCSFTNKLTTTVPILGGGERVGTLVLAKYDVEFDEDDLILAEYGATVVGMEILRVKAERAEEEARKKAAVQIAVGTLSYSELEAVEHIFAELGGGEGLLVASKIADRVGITRSVIVNALRKFESAGVIESKSLGMKGTYIRVLNDYLLDELEKHTKHMK
ncbi:GTP-sensing transcriptional pleiotropic repressor CodY [Desulfosporosinus orientis DSM 765]|uniref:Global transcriptional regulator CodY n=1 Tax=Desulfosporosinus orientis (strain ATCC 19365 / DSM 765 / NCIMB 8382 / VKM B-1628 / Singapore I) TaxID=768706 RepID=G7WE78_DESOD|nr:GTP-sensing pleiotropic transcriptional regulator CodY [Desulfosporosinus orientis]AET70054.1 GTP-sensing transcriptional pleiotropic repressor CodY [Desulfosporosinus orientis DSM 765]